MKVKIIKPIPLEEECETDSYYMPSLGLSRLYMYLKNKGFDIVQQDLFKRHDRQNFQLYTEIRKSVSYYYDHIEELFDRDLSSEFIECVNHYITKEELVNIDVLLVSVYDCSHYSSVFGIIVAKYFKSINPEGVVVLGGEWEQNPYALNNLDNLFRHNILDYYILDRGEKALELLLNNLKCVETDLTNIPGLHYFEDGEIKKNIPSGVDIAFSADFDGVDLTQYYWTKAPFFAKRNPEKFINKPLLMLPVQHMTGCINKCAFCGYSASKCVSMRPVECVDNIERLYDKHGARFFFFVDATLNISRKFITEFCDEIVKRNLEIYWTSCASFRGLDSPEIFHLLRKAGACRLIYGLETASPRLLKYINKGLDVGQVENGVRWSHEAGIWTDLELIAGLPTENDSDLQCTLDFINRNNRYISYVWLNRFFLTVGSIMYTHPEKYSIVNIRPMGGKLLDDYKNDIRYQYLFDEIDGLKWEDKVNQIENSFLLVRKELEKYKLSYRDEKPEYTNALLYLYSCLDRPKEIRRYFNMYVEAAMLNNV